MIVETCEQVAGTLSLVVSPIVHNSTQSISQHVVLYGELSSSKLLSKPEMFIGNPPKKCVVELDIDFHKKIAVLFLVLTKASLLIPVKQKAQMAER